jgi:hypothetical protein
MLDFDPEAVRRNVRSASSEDLLDRVTAYRTGMESEAIKIVETELQRRGILAAEIEGHDADRARPVILRRQGFAYRCSYCDRPAAFRRWGWHWLWGLVPVLPCIQNYCDRHVV